MAGRHVFRRSDGRELVCRRLQTPLGFAPGLPNAVDMVPGDWIVCDPEAGEFLFLHDQDFRREHRPLDDHASREWEDDAPIVFDESRPVLRWDELTPGRDYVVATKPAADWLPAGGRRGRLIERSVDALVMTNDRARELTRVTREEFWYAGDVTASGD